MIILDADIELGIRNFFKTESSIPEDYFLSKFVIYVDELIIKKEPLFKSSLLEIVYRIYISKLHTNYMPLSNIESYCLAVYGLYFFFKDDEDLLKLYTSVYDTHHKNLQDMIRWNMKN